MDSTIDSPFFKFGQHGLQYKIIFDYCDESDQTKIIVSVKSTPKWVKQINLKCKIYLCTINRNVEISGIIYFDQNRLKSVLINVISLGLNTRELDKLTFR